MKSLHSLPVAAALALAAMLLPTTAVAQPILDRVEQLLRDQVDAASKTPPAEPGYLGLVGDEPPDGQGGVRVLEVVPEHAAAQAGLHPGDRITQIDGREIRAMDDMAAALAGKRAGAKLSITAARDGQTRQFDVTLGSRQSPPGNVVELPPPQSSPDTQSAARRPRLGLRTVPVTDDIRRRNNLPEARGAHVISVSVDSPAQRAGIPLGAVVTAVGDTQIDSPQKLAEAIASAPGDVRLTYYAAGQLVNKQVSLPPAAPPAANAKPQVTARQPLPELPLPELPLPELPLPELPLPELPVPNEVEPPTIENSGLDGDQRFEALERRVQQLEERLKNLEAAQAPNFETDRVDEN